MTAAIYLPSVWICALIGLAAFCAAFAFLAVFDALCRQVRRRGKR